MSSATTRELYHPVYLRARRNGQTSLEEILPVRTFSSRTSPEQDVVHPQTAKSRRVGLRKYIYEVWHFPETCDSLFQDYVNTWLKIKQEASGWPKWVGDDETKRQQYIGEYYEHEDIQLEYDKIEYNAGLRQLAKMMLNSTWGKFGQRLNKIQVQTFDDPQAFHRFLDTDSLDVRHVSVVDDYLVDVHYQHQEEDIPVSPNLNIFVACFTTCWARLHLYEALELLSERVLDFDTNLVPKARAHLRSAGSKCHGLWDNQKPDATS